MPINIIDLFAGPGGLGEGFSAFKTPNSYFPFKIQASIEKEASAHRTLQLRAFFRQFRDTEVPDEYYEYIRNPNNLKKAQLEELKEKLFSHYSKQSKAAVEETLVTPQTLGNDISDKLINRKLSKLLKEHEGEDFVVIGGPPCQAYSLAGRSRMNGIDGYRIEDDYRAELYKEYLKILYKVAPKVFVMENVKGILSAKLNGKLIFTDILKDLHYPGKALYEHPSKKQQYRIFSLVEQPDGYDDKGLPIYKKGAFTIKTEQHGVPQTRHRVVLLGVRTDINISPETLIRTIIPTTVEAVIDSIPPLRSGLSKGGRDSSEEWFSVIKEAGNSLIKELKKSNSNKQISVIKNHMKNICGGLDRGNSRFVPSKSNGFHNDCPKALRKWIYDSKLGGYANHETKAHMVEDLKRYLWISTYGELNGESPKSSDFPKFLAPKHKNWKTGHHADRFKVQVKNKTASTITCHLSKDGHKSIHYNPQQCRSFTVREAARIQTFPDNYFFEGTRTEQYVQVGNAVPPYLAFQIADIVYSILKREQ
jgi:DNA (cytosine-5)-methyltransferase 1